jgi:hypothetical protein
VGLTTALNVLPGGYVVVGSLPTSNGKSATAQYGCLIVLDSDGKAVERGCPTFCVWGRVVLLVFRGVVGLRSES